MNAATKANRTRKARKLLKDTYGQLTHDELKLLGKGHTCWRVAMQTGSSVTSVAAVLANRTRGTYDHILDHCNF